MKKQILFFLMVFKLFSVNAQLANGSIAPDWTMTDIDGNTHTLYDYLDSGKAVILDFSATWCPPCWDYHNTHALEDLYTNYGPSGTDEVMVFLIEPDTSTTLADLNGTGSNTLGDWVTGTNYPIIDDASQNSAYNIISYPTVYLICPSKIITEIGTVPTTSIYSAIEAAVCQPATEVNDPGIASFTGDTLLPSCNGGTANLTVDLQNFGTDILSSVTIEVMDGSSSILTYNWSGSLATYEIENVTLGSVNITSAVNLTIAITSIDDNIANNSINTTIELAPYSLDNTFTLTIDTDNWAFETTWDVIDSDGNTIQSGGPYISPLSTEIETINIPIPGCYEFKIYDSNGDGICCAFGDGSYRLEDSNGPLFSGDEFLSEESHLWGSSGTVDVSEINVVNDLTIYPNPFNNGTNIQFELTETKSVKLSVFDMVGRKLGTENLGVLSFGIHDIEFNGTNLKTGVYLFKLTVDDETIIKRVILAK